MGRTRVHGTDKPLFTALRDRLVSQATVSFADPHTPGEVFSGDPEADERACTQLVAVYCKVIDMKDDVRISLRLPEDIHAALTALAKPEGRSVQSKIIELLRKALETK
jgi:hypothetical protein